MKIFTFLKFISIFLIVSLAAIFAYYSLNKKPELAKIEDFANKLPQRAFEIDSKKDTVIATENGLVLAIPGDAFETLDGKLVEGNVDFEVAEAFEDLDILKAGLSTTSNGEPLETGGMFFLSANQNGEELKLKEGKKILSQIPNLHPDKEMMLFDGVIDSTGNINWVNPKSFKKDLLTLDIMTLDFYPEGYLKELNRGRKKASGSMKSANYPRYFADSMYYSYARLFEKHYRAASPVPPKSTELTAEEIRRLIPKSGITIEWNSWSRETLPTENPSPRDSISERGVAEVDPCPIPSGINPAKVKAIWNEKFNSTILATREFEKRMRFIHLSRQDRILKLYVKNIDKPLWFSDSIAARKLKGKLRKRFFLFYKQRKGGVKIQQGLAQNLSQYFDQKQRVFTSETTGLYEKYEADKLKLVQEFEHKKSEKDQQEFQQRADVFTEEYNENLSEAYRQLGERKGRSREVLRGTPFVASVGLGAKNIDRFIFASTRTRKTSSYTGPDSRKKIKLGYTPLRVKIMNTEKFDKIFAYLIPDSLNSFNRMQSSDNVNFSFPLNMQLNYRLVCLGYIGETPYFTEVEKAIPLDYELTLEASTEEVIRDILRFNSSLIQKEIESDQAFYKVEFAYDQKQKKFKRDSELNVRMGRFLFPMLLSPCFLPNKNGVVWDEFGQFSAR